MAVRGGGALTARPAPPATATTEQRLPGSTVRAPELSPILHPVEPIDDGIQGGSCAGYTDLDDRSDTVFLDDSDPRPCSQYAGDLLPPDGWPQHRGFQNDYASVVNTIPGITVRKFKRGRVITISDVPLHTRANVVKVYRDARGRSWKRCPRKTGRKFRCRRAYRDDDTVVCSGWGSGAYQNHELWWVRIEGLQGVACVYIRTEEEFPRCAPAIPSLGSASRWCSPGIGSWDEPPS